jgi:hypothetical protein
MLFLLIGVTNNTRAIALDDVRAAIKQKNAKWTTGDMLGANWGGDGFFRIVHSQLYNEIPREYVLKKKFFCVKR